MCCAAASVRNESGRVWSDTGTRPLHLITIGEGDCCKSHGDSQDYASVLPSTHIGKAVLPSVRVESVVHSTQTYNA